jgi:hypothetical protein
MKKQGIIISFIAILVTMIANIGDLRCQENSSMVKEQYQSKYIERIAKQVSEDNVKNDKNMKAEILGWIIQHNLFCEYQKIDSKELEDRLERSR